MKITNLYGLSADSTALIAQNMVARYAEQLGFKELGIYRYDISTDSSEMLRTRLDGIFASVHNNDTIVFQLPTWNGIEFDERLVRQSMLYSGVKKIIFVHDVIPFMWENNLDWLETTIRIFNLADVLILPSRQMEQRLRQYGLTVNKIIYQDMWDYDTHAIVDKAPFTRQLFFLGNVDKFTFVKDWSFDLSLHCFSMPSMDREFPSNVFVHDFLKADHLVERLNQMGGFGLVWSEDAYWQEYLKVSNPYKLATYLAANIPVVVPRYLSSAAIIEKNHLGIVVDSIEEAIGRISQMTLDEYEEMQQHIKAFGSLIKNGYFTKKVLIDALHLANRVDIENHQPLAPRFNIHVKNIEQTLNYIQNYQTSVARFGDGEIDLIFGHSIPYQEYDERLSQRLRALLFTQSNEKLLICLSDVFSNLEQYNDYAQSFWKANFAKYASFYLELGRKVSWFGSTFISRPYMDLQDKTLANKSFVQLKSLWQDKDILIVEGEFSRSGVGNDLFEQAKSIKRIIAPAKNAFSRYEEILDSIQKNVANRLVFLMLGPTAKLLVEDLSYLGIQAIDLGHIDSEYEWFKMGATSKVKLAHKHTAEHNFDENIELIDDEIYLSQIVDRVE